MTTQETGSTQYSGDQSRKIQLRSELKVPFVGDNLVSEKNSLLHLEVVIWLVSCAIKKSAC